MTSMMRKSWSWRLALLGSIVWLLLAGCGQITATRPAATLPAADRPVKEVGLPATLALPPESTPLPETSGRLAGVITGLDPADSVKLRLEFLKSANLAELRSELLSPLPDRQPEVGQVKEQFQVTIGPWQAEALKLPPGLYRLVPKAEGYVGIPHSYIFAVPETGLAWRYLRLDFEFLPPANAPARVGVPLCPERPLHGGVYVLPAGTPTPTPSPPLPATTPAPAGDEHWPPGTCYAGHFYKREIPPAGLRGQITGLAAGQVATITLYALPPVAGENYAIGGAPPIDGHWIYPPDITPLAGLPTIAPEWSLTATLMVANGSWGLIDPALAGHKYLVVAEGAEQAAKPTGYEVVIFGGKLTSLADKVDFALAR